MADSDKNILITPNTGATTDPKIVFSSGATSGDPITLSTVDDGTTSTLSFEGSAGQLFSISNDMSGTIFSVGDVSGIPSIEADATGDVRIAEFGGNVQIGNSSGNVTVPSTLSVLAGKVVSEKPQHTSGSSTNAHFRAFPSATTDTTGLTSVFLGTSTVDGYGVSLNGARKGASGTPTFTIRTHNNSVTGAEVLTIADNGVATFASTISSGALTVSGSSDLHGGGSHLGNHEFAASSTDTGYSTRSIELRESNYTANGTATPPGIGFHWGGVVASNITMDNLGTIEIRNNPGTGFEEIRAANYYVGAGTGTRALTTADEGSGNGLDADTVDGLHASDFLTSSSLGTTTINFSNGRGINFNAQGSGSFTSNVSTLLNDYERGQWTCTLRSLSSEPATKVTATGEYQRVGDIVTVWITFNNVNTTGYVGDCYFTLPYTVTGVSPNTPSPGSVLSQTGFLTWLYETPVPLFTNSSNVVFLWSQQSGGNATLATIVAGTGKTIYITGSYRAAAN